MADLTLDEVKDIGTAAIRRVIGDTSSRVEVGYTFGAEDQAYYLFTIWFATERTWRNALSLSSELTRTIGDGLWARGDATLAFTRLLSDGSWDLQRHAAAE